MILITIAESVIDRWQFGVLCGTMFCVAALSFIERKHTVQIPMKNMQTPAARCSRTQYK